MEQAERPGASPAAAEGITRSQHVVYTLPHTVEALTQLLTPSLERLDVTQEGVQLMIVTADAESAVAISDLVYRLAGPQGIEVLPVTSANRAARLLIDRPVHAIAGPATELQTLIQRSILKMSGVRTIVLAWADDILGAGDEGVKALETIFADVPKETSRSILTRQITPEVEQLIERYARTARRVKGSEPADGEEANATLVQYLVVSPTSRAVTLRRLLDDLDPPSAAVIVRTDSSRDAATHALAQLGYRRSDDAVRVVDGAAPSATHTVILFDAPVTRAELSNVAEGAVNIVALVTPNELEPLRQLASALTPFSLSGPGATARRRDRILCDELRGILEHGVATRELLSLEPLLQQYDGAEIAAAAIRLLERERAKPPAAATPVARLVREDRPTDRWNDAGGESRPKRSFTDRPNNDTKDRPAREFNDRPKREFNDRPKREFSDRPKRDFGDRPKRDFNDRPKREYGDRPKRDFGDRPQRDFGDRPKRDFSDRPKRDFNDRPHRDFSDRPKREYGGQESSDRPQRGFSDRPKRDFSGKPKRDFGDRGKGNFGRGSRGR